MKKIIFVLLLSVSIGCKSTLTKSDKIKGNLKELVNIMQGYYSSEKQSLEDKEYYNISLHMTPIWKTKGNYLFVEQALFDKQDKPYRVRVYKVYQNKNGHFISEIYSIKSEKDWIGKWATPSFYDNLTEADIELKKGCEVVLQRIAKNHFEGQTGNKTCPSELRGATYATSIVTVLQNKLISWDQGFDAADKQVWGATKGAYIFEKIKE
ncbi:MAG: hypothetical protein HC854_05245 [Flavobacterium sp.]|nr:hypothetical protein [Flavobacterium sp.]